MRPKLEVADIFRHHGDAFPAAQGNRLSRDQRKVMAAIEACRTPALGGHVERCEDCGATRIAYNSCRDRHCPKCQGLARLQWLADRRAELLPVPYFHVVFTVPAPIAAIALQNKALVYGILFKAAAETIRVIAADTNHLGTETGMIAILHTWGQTLTHHPHVHCIVPGGGLGPDGRWVACKPNFFLPVHVLSRCYRRLFLERLRAAFDAGGLAFHGELARLRDPFEFAQYLKRHCQSKFYTACSRTTAGGSSTVFAHESPMRSVGFDAENRLYLFALTVPLKLTAAGLKAIVVDAEDAQTVAVGDASTIVDIVPANAANANDAADEATGKIAEGATIATTVETAAAKPAKGTPREGTKIAQAINLLQRDPGATLDDLIAATGWLPHTARAALTGLRHRGYEVRLQRADKGRASIYRVVSSEARAS